jgi:hypothetical protein
MLNFCSTEPSSTGVPLLAVLDLLLPLQGEGWDGDGVRVALGD